MGEKNQYQILQKEFDKYYELANKALKKNDFRVLVANLEKAGQCQLNMSKHCPESERLNHVRRGKELLKMADGWKKKHPECFTSDDENRDDTITSDKKKYRELKEKFDEYYKLAMKSQEENDYRLLVHYLKKAAECQLKMCDCCTEKERKEHMNKGKELIEMAEYWQRLHPECF